MVLPQVEVLVVKTYTSKQWDALRIKLPNYCYVTYNLRKYNLSKPENAITAASCTSFSCLYFGGVGYLVIPLYDYYRKS